MNKLMLLHQTFSEKHNKLSCSGKGYNKNTVLIKLKIINFDRSQVLSFT